MYLKLRKKNSEKLYTIDEVGEMLGKSKQRVISTLSKLNVVFWNYGVLEFGKNYKDEGLGNYVINKHTRKADNKVILKRELAFTEKGVELVKKVFYGKL